MSRGTMTHRCEIRRNSGTTDAWNRPALQAFADMTVIATSQPCRVYHRQQREIRLVQDENKTARVDEMQVFFPPGTDVKAEDRLGDVKDRQGRVLYAGPFVVKQPHRRRNHIQALIEGHNVAA